jgi:deoxycytidylate deaminase
VKHVITAVVYDKRGRPIATAQNSYIKTHPLMAKAARKAGQPYKLYLHAEIAALIKVDWAKAHSIFVSRYNAAGTPMHAAPCNICSKFIADAGIKIIRHT